MKFLVTISEQVTTVSGIDVIEGGQFVVADKIDYLIQDYSVVSPLDFFNEGTVEVYDKHYVEGGIRQLYSTTLGFHNSPFPNLDLVYYSLLPGAFGGDLIQK